MNLRSEALEDRRSRENIAARFVCFLLNGQNMVLQLNIVLYSRFKLEERGFVFGQGVKRGI